MPQQAGLSPLDAAAKEVFEQTLRKHGGNLTRAAEELDISRPTAHAHAVRYELWPWKKD